MISLSDQHSGSQGNHHLEMKTNSNCYFAGCLSEYFNLHVVILFVMY